MDILQNKIVTIRKEHECWGCCESFQAGKKMRKFVSVDGGDFQASYWCEKCDKRLEDIDDWTMQEGFAPGDLKQIHDDYYGGLK